MESQVDHSNGSTDILTTVSRRSWYKDDYRLLNLLRLGCLKAQSSVPYYLYFSSRGDLPLDVSKSTVKIYADDTTQVAFGRTVEEVETIFTRELRLLTRPADENKMALNHSNTKSIIVCTKPKFRGLDGENLKTIKANMILYSGEVNYLA